MIFLQIKLVQLLLTTALFIVCKPECDKDFSCPEGCDIRFSGPCPESCNCPTISECPDIPCPAPPPTCIVYTKHNGCQSCACQAPFSVVEPKITARPIISRTSVTTTTKAASPSSTFSKVTLSSTTIAAIRSATATTATIPNTNKSTIATTTTIPNTNKSSTTTITTTATDSTSAIPVTTTTTTTTTSAASFGRNESIQPLHAASFNLPPPKVATFAKVSSPLDSGCNAQMQNEIDTEFGALYADLKEKSRTASSIFPAIFEYSKSQLSNQCSLYKSASSRLSFEARRNCITNYDIYDTTYNSYSYACGYGTEMYFSRYFECLGGLKSDPKVASCDSPLPNDQTQDVNSDSVCNAYDSILNCIYESVVRKCGYDGWEIEYQFLSSVVRRFSRNCNLHRINLTLNLRQNVKIV